MCECVCVHASRTPQSRWGTYVGRIAYVLEMKIYDYLNACNRNVCSGWITRRPSSQPLWLPATWQALGSRAETRQRNACVQEWGRWKCSLAAADTNDRRRSSRKVDNERRAWLNTSVDLGALASSMRTAYTDTMPIMHSTVCAYKLCVINAAPLLSSLVVASAIARARALVYCGNSHKWQLRVDLCIRGVQLEIICRPFLSNWEFGVSQSGIYKQQQHPPLLFIQRQMSRRRCRGGRETYYFVFCATTKTDESKDERTKKKKLPRICLFAL